MLNKITTTTTTTTTHTHTHTHTQIQLQPNNKNKTKTKQHQQKIKSTHTHNKFQKQKFHTAQTWDGRKTQTTLTDMVSMTNIQKKDTNHINRYGKYNLHTCWLCIPAKFVHRKIKAMQWGRETDRQTDRQTDRELQWCETEKSPMKIQSKSPTRGAVQPSTVLYCLPVKALSQEILA